MSTATTTPGKLQPDLTQIVNTAVTILHDAARLLEIKKQPVGFVLTEHSSLQGDSKFQSLFKGSFDTFNGSVLVGRATAQDFDQSELFLTVDINTAQLRVQTSQLESTASPYYTATLWGFGDVLFGGAVSHGTPAPDPVPFFVISISKT